MIDRPEPSSSGSGIGDGMRVFETGSQEETEALGGMLGALLTPGDLVTLSGELGSGKTCLVRGIVSALLPSCSSQVASPTYAIMNEYCGKTTVYHVDCYRLRGTEDAVELGIEDCIAGDGVSLVEWPERIEQLLKHDRMEILLEHTGEESRRITCIPHGAHAAGILSLLPGKA